ncbi:MAG: right-handed parallel beta-helix repeat-containing protein [Kiritimatiellae bacterium]|nr:right-handed parallel beta-helix repeat-containing protein [Kiritimatiellia bacterium]
MKKLVFGTMLSAGLLAFGDDVATLESNLKSDIMSKVNQVNPIDSATGQRKYISFAMISDIHKCKRVAGDDAASNPVTTYWYASAGCLTESEQSVRLLGSVTADAGLDAVIFGGDFSTAPIKGDAGRLTVEEYTNEIWNVKAMLGQHLPASVPLFAVDGNHDRHYVNNKLNLNFPMVKSDSDWAYVLTNFNTSASAAHAHNVDITYHRDLANAKLGDNVTGHYAGNSYHLDFRRLLASGGPNVRIACVSMYDTSTGNDPNYRVYDAAQFYDSTGALYDADLTPENTVMGMIAHGTEETLAGTLCRNAAGTLMNGYMNGYSNPKNKIGPWNRGALGKGYFGLVAAHLHYVNTKELSDSMDSQFVPDAVKPSAVSVSAAYAVNMPSKTNQHQLGTDQAYHFSIFVIDTDNGLLHEIRVGGVNQNNVHESPVVNLYGTNIRMSSSGSDPVQTPPILGTVTVSPAVTNATLSGTISSLGTGATACDAYLALGPSAGALGAAAKIAEGATASFNYAISNLTAETTYYYSLSISNNAETVMGAVKSGNFTTGAEPVEPGPEHIHVWGDATYVWSAGNTTCTGSATCTADSTHVTNETVTASYAVVQAATTEAAGTGRYTAVFPGEPFATQTKDVTIPKVIPPPQPGEGIQPGETAAETRQTIQDAIDAAVPTQGTVTLGNGLFDIDAQLNVTGGVTLVGQGWTNTTIRFADTKAGSENRVVNIDGGVVSHVTLTGGKVDNNNKSGGGAYLTDGTISWCCITNNYAKRSYGGGGVFISGTGTAKIDHTIIADNSAATAFLNGIGGGIGIRGRSGLRVEIDACLVYGNTAGASDRTSHGGGIAVTGVDASDSFTTVIRNTTIANNSVVGAGLGGGLYIDQADTTLINCLVSGNTAEANAGAGDANVAYKDATIMSAVGSKTTTCIFGGTPLFVDAANGDYHLAENSPAIEAGTDYAGLEKDLDGKYFSYLKPAIGCYEYGEYGPRPADEWDIPGTNGGIKGLDDGHGGKIITFTAIARDGETVAVGFQAAEIGASIGSTFGLVCKDSLDDTKTFTLNATLTDIEGALGELQATTSKSQLFIVGIGAAE